MNGNIIYKDESKTHHSGKKLYLDLTQFVPISGNNLGVPAQIIKTYNSPIIQNPQDYNCSVIRFSVPGETIPLINWANLITTYPFTVYEITFIYGTNKPYTIPVEFIYQGPLSDPSKSNILFMYQYQLFLDMINATFNKLQAKINMDFPGLVPNAPFVLYSNTSNLFQLWADPAVFWDNLSTPVQIQFNNGLYPYFETLPYKSYNNSGVTLSVRSLALAGGPSNSNSYTFGSVVYYVMTQEVTSLYKWSWVNSIYMTSSLPTAGEYIDVSNTGIISNSSNSLQIIADFLITPQTNEYSGTISYLPTAEYRRVTLTRNSSGLQNINVNFFWTDRTGRSYPLIIPPGSGVSIKLLFEEK